MQAWSGLTGLRDAVEPIRRRLRIFRNAQGEELLDVPEAPRPKGDTEAPPRFLPEFDNVLLAHADRTRIADPRVRRHLFAGAGLMLGTVLIDGFVGGRWRLVRQRENAILTIDTFARLTAADRAALETEGGRLLRFFAGNAKTCDIRFGRRWIVA